MPKVRPLTDIQAAKKRLTSNLKLIQGRRNGSEMGKMLGISACTYNRRLHDPMSLTASEIFLICKIANITAGEFMNEELSVGVNK